LRNTEAKKVWGRVAYEKLIVQFILPNTESKKVWGRVPYEKLIVAEMLKVFFAFYGT
jgi:hypothetical protein